MLLGNLTVKKKRKTERNTPLIPPQLPVRKREPNKEETTDPLKNGTRVFPLAAIPQGRVFWFTEA
jgi:hypothetical protein